MLARIVLSAVAVGGFLSSSAVAGGKATCRFEDVQVEGQFIVPPTCTKLALGGSKLGDAGVVALAAALTESSSGRLVELHLPDTGMGPDGAAAVALYLSRAGSGNSLRILNLYGNFVSVREGGHLRGWARQDYIS